ncbi:hypothetical protein pb186bvf_016696 [Paramecium bursaria]
MSFQIKTKVKVQESLCRQYVKLTVNEYHYNRQHKWFHEQKQMKLLKQLIFQRVQTRISSSAR